MGEAFVTATQAIDCPFPALSAPAIRWDGLASQTMVCYVYNSLKMGVCCIDPRTIHYTHQHATYEHTHTKTTHPTHTLTHTLCSVGVGG